MKRLMDLLGLVLIWLLISGTALSADDTPFTPLPLEIRIIPPSSDLSEDRAGFSGIWYGFWDGKQATTLIIEQIAKHTAVVVYSWGEYKGKEGGWIRNEWKVTPGKIEKVFEKDGITISFSLDGGVLKGTYIKKGEGGHISYSTLQRDLPKPAPAAPVAKTTPAVNNSGAAADLVDMTVNLALNKPAEASAVALDQGKFLPGMAFDGNNTNLSKSRWTASAEKPQWLSVDLQKEYSISLMRICWSRKNYAKEFNIEKAVASGWELIGNFKSDGDWTELKFDPPLKAQKLRLNCLKSSGIDIYYTIYEWEIYGPKQ
jgi:hypothetical protein